VTYLQLGKPDQDKQTNVILFGADYKELPVKNLYKALNVAKPDLIMM
jgi:hypothetical protein